MASSSSSASGQPKIIEVIVEAGKKAFDPNIDAATRASGVEEYNKLIERSVVHDCSLAFKTGY